MKSQISKKSSGDPSQLRWRGTIIAFVGSLAAALVCLPLLGTLVKQVNLMVPQAGTVQEQRATNGARAAWRSDPRINNPLAILNVLKQRNPNETEIAKWAGSMTDNSLPAWAELLVVLRAANIGPNSAPVTQPALTTSQPALDARVASALQAIEYAPPVRTAMASMHDRFVEELVDAGVEPRRAEAAFWGERWNPMLAAYRPVLRELSHRLLALARQEARAGRTDSAIRAYRAGIRMWTQVVADSPLPEVATLAASQLEPLVTGLGQLQHGTEAVYAAQQLRGFQKASVDVPERDLAVYPCLFGHALVSAEQASVLQSIKASAGLLLCGCVMAVICLILLIAVLVTRAFGRMPLAWRWGSWSALVAPAVVALPAVFAVLLVSSDAVPFLWLASGRSIGAMIFAPAALLVLWLAATHAFLRPTDKSNSAVLPMWAVWGGLAVVVAAALALTLIVPIKHEAWRAPAGIQAFRRMGIVAGSTSILVFVIGSAWAWMRRRRSGLPAGVLSRGGLAVASGAMCMLLVAAAIGLGVNRVRDEKHEAAFARVMNDPTAAQLGADWQKEYFAPARALVE